MKQLVMGLLADAILWGALVFFSYAAGYVYVSIGVCIFAVLYLGWCFMTLYGLNQDPSYSDDDYEDDEQEPRNNDYDDRDPILQQYYLTDEDLAELEREREWAQQLSEWAQQLSEWAQQLSDDAEFKG